MTQAQRKKQLAEAKALVKRLEKEVAENEPLTEPMKKTLLLIAANGGVVVEKAERSGLTEYRAGSVSGTRLSRQAIWPLQWRIMIESVACSMGVDNGVKWAVFPLTEWGKKQAEELAKKASE